jgi:hypothetical protein
MAAFIKIENDEIKKKQNEAKKKNNRPGVGRRSVARRRM